MIETRDLEIAAQRYLPRFVFDFVSGGSGQERALRNNSDAFEQIKFIPKTLNGISSPSTSVNVLGKSYCAPFGVAPIGMLGLVRKGAETMLGRAACERNIPMILSTAATQSIEDVAKVAEENFWFQYYPTQLQSLNDSLIKRARDVGCQTLMLTVDTPVPGRRLRDVRNGLQIPPRLTLKTIGQLALRPRWAIERALAGTPELANLGPMSGEAQRSFADTMRLLSAPSMTWEDVAKLREGWHGHLIVKGLLHPDDVLHCVTLGVDGVVLSNHGGRQLDSAIAPTAMLSTCRQVAGDKMTIIVDGGVRSGDDIAKCLALGADLVLIGRPFVYAATVGEQHITGLIDLLVSELENTLSLVGVPIEQLAEVLAQNLGKPS
ncbi:alpha-hydroxy acid oxidase [Sulfitobacter sp. F26169L]|uniref:alpha-hydroxy acid oxidase n=1 Tax=Sulfitobacter sp. F26169L TaxID=2996015 RepID=UPI002260B0A4|nr:alpha-hydroxy acid oxidase [Sulfitobacter sp. F26169L]MCX7565978.1 alpha-hydroxy acid oxidase [Sulfitobacter sp. F26169L]